MAKNPAYYLTTTLLRVRGLRNNSVDPPPVVNDATVTASIDDSEGTEIVAPFSLTTTGSGGNYQGEIAHDAGLVPRQTYKAKVTIVDTGGAERYAEVDVECQVDER